MVTKVHGLLFHYFQYNLQADMTRRQLEYEAQRVRQLMTENLGTSEQIAARHDARLQRIHMNEAEMLRLQQRHREQQVRFMKVEFRGSEIEKKS